jgi:hypothetical protein
MDSHASRTHWQRLGYRLQTLLLLSLVRRARRLVTGWLAAVGLAGAGQLHVHLGETPISRARERRSIPLRRHVISVSPNTGGTTVMAFH